jgi:hypothetical protein
MAALSLAVVALFAVARTAISIRIFARTARSAKATERKPIQQEQNEG